MYYITKIPTENGNYGNPMGQPFPDCLELPEALLAPYLDAKGFVTITTDGDTVTAVKTNEEALAEYEKDHPSTDALEGAKEQRIQESKEALAAYLEAHPIQYTDGQYYAVTQEKQSQLTSKLAVAQMAKQAGQPYSLTWNSTGEVCKTWELDELAGLAFAIDKRVTALVTYQQKQEIKMREAADLDALDAIVVDYDTVS